MAPVGGASSAAALASSEPHAWFKPPPAAVVASWPAPSGSLDAVAASTTALTPITTSLSEDGDAAAAPAASSGFVYVAGSGECEQLGLGDSCYSAEVLRVVPSLARVAIARVAVGGLHTLAIAAGSGVLWSWGCNDDCALGRGGAENRPGRVRGALDGGGVALITAGDSHSVAVDGAGRVFAWGTYKGKDGYLGFDAATPKQATPRWMESVNARYGPVVAASSGADHTGVVTAAGMAVLWGYGGQGQLGKVGLLWGRRVSGCKCVTAAAP